jgi:hypothetical protein
MIKTKEKGTAYEFSGNHCVEFFSKAGSLYDTPKKIDFYEGNESALSLFQKAWASDKETSFKLLLWLRDSRGGAGNRSGFRACLKWLASKSPKWIAANMPWVPEVGRWDDLRVLFNTELETAAADYWGTEIVKNKNVLAAKWADRTDKPLFNVFRALTGKEDVGEFRRFLAKIRKTHIVEHKMCHDQWYKIEYEHVPSVAMSRYTKAFGKHDKERFEQYKQDLKDGKAEIKASVLFPHDCVRTANNGDKKIADAQFKALPNYLEHADERIIVLCDTSGSMQSTIGGSVQAVHVSTGMALYCSDKIGKDNPFYRKFIGFESESNFKDWSGMTFSEALDNQHIFDGACGATRIDKALDLILKTANFFKLSEDQMPTTLLIISDMQFHQGVRDGGKHYGYGTLRASSKKVMGEVQIALDRWTENGYNIPKIIYWNTAGYAGSPDEIDSKNIALVSGFSPSILQAIFSGEEFDPVSIMMRALSKYNGVINPDKQEQKGEKKTKKKKAKI